MKSKLLLAAAVLVLSACGGGGTSAPSVSLPSAPTVPLSTSDAIKQMEIKGQLPKLDRTSSIAGTDADSNGIRDDIDAYIQALPDTPLQKKALRQMAKAFQASMLVPDSASNVSAAISVVIRSITCARGRYSSFSDYAVQKDTLKAFTFNTKKRWNAWDAFNAAANGSTWVSPEFSEGQCDA